MYSFFFFKQKTAYEMRISDWSSDLCFSDLIADRIATIPAHRTQDHITLEMAPLEIRHRSVRPISAKHAQASRFLQQSPPEVATPLIHAMLDRQYRATLDEPIGILGDITPRAAVQTAAGRHR